MSLRAYLEWLPEKFREERAKGTLEVKTKPPVQKRLPGWLSFPLNILKRNRQDVYKNGKLLINDRLVLLSNDYYHVEDTTIHYMIVAYLMAQGLIPQKEDLLNFEDKLPTQTKMIAMQVDFKNIIRLSESYHDNVIQYIQKHEQQMEEQFHGAIKKLQKQGFKIRWESIE